MDPETARFILQGLKITLAAIAEINASSTVVVRFNALIETLDREDRELTLEDLEALADSSDDIFERVMAKLKAAQSVE